MLSFNLYFFLAPLLCCAIQFSLLSKMRSPHGKQATDDRTYECYPEFFQISEPEQ